jgi:putative phosphoribosyl transferase
VIRSRALNVPLNLIIVRKIGFPGQPELAVGAVAESGSVVFNEDLMAEGRLSRDLLKREIDHQKDEIARRVVFYRSGEGRGLEPASKSLKKTDYVYSGRNEPE